MAERGTCGECKSWLWRCVKDYALRDGAKIEIRRCGALSGNAADPWPVYTPADASCPAWERREDAAERAARRIGERLPTVMACPADHVMAEIIREEIEKDKEGA